MIHGPTPDVLRPTATPDITPAGKSWIIPSISHDAHILGGYPVDRRSRYTLLLRPADRSVNVLVSDAVSDLMLTVGPGEAADPNARATIGLGTRLQSRRGLSPRTVSPTSTGSLSYFHTATRIYRNQPTIAAGRPSNFCLSLHVKLMVQ